MKTKFYWLALLGSAAMIAQANAGGHHGGGGGGGSGGSVAVAGPSNSGRSGSFRSMPTRTFSSGRVIYSGQRFSSVGLHSPSPTGFRPHYVNPNAHASSRSRQFARENVSRSNSIARSSNGTRTIAHVSRAGNGAARVKNGNATLRADWRNHVFAQRSANWQRDWDRGRDHWWHGHRCHFFNGSWVIFDLGFYPWDTFWYPYGSYYGYGYYPYSYNYDPGYYDSYGYQDQEYYGANSYGDQFTDSTVAAAQERLAQEGYYRGEIDGILGPQTRRAIARYQSDQGLRVTGALTRDTVQALELERVALSNEKLTYD